MRVLVVMGCRSLVATALVAKAKGPGFDSIATTETSLHFAFVLTPLSEKDSIYIKHVYFDLSSGLFGGQSIVYFRK